MYSSKRKKSTFKKYVYDDLLDGYHYSKEQEKCTYFARLLVVCNCGCKTLKSSEDLVFKFHSVTMFCNHYECRTETLFYICSTG